MEEDPVRNQLKILLKIWPRLFTNPVAVADLITMAGKENDEFNDNSIILKDVLKEIAGDRDTINSRKLSYYLRRNANVIVEGLMLERAGENSTGKLLWRVSER